MPIIRDYERKREKKIMLSEIKNKLLSRMREVEKKGRNDINTYTNTRVSIRRDVKKINIF